MSRKLWVCTHVSSIHSGIALASLLLTMCRARFSKYSVGWRLECPETWELVLRLFSFLPPFSFIEYSTV